MAYEQPFDSPPTYIESTSRPNRPARPASAASAQPGRSPSQFVTSGGWIPPSGTWEPAAHHTNSSSGYAPNPSVPPLPPRATTSTAAAEGSSDDGSARNYSARSSYPEEKRSSGLFGGFGSKRSSNRDSEKAPLPDSRSNSSSDEAPSSSSGFWRGNRLGASSSSAATAGASNSKRDKGKSRQKEAEQAPSSRFTDTSEEALRAYLSRIPTDAQKALAPLGVLGDAKSIEGVYSVELSTQTKWIPAANGQGTTVLPTCSFTSNARNDVDVTLYLRPNEQQRQQDLLQQQQQGRNGHGPPLPPRTTQGNVPLEILLRAAKGRIRFSLPEKLPDRALRIICTLECKLFPLYLSYPFADPVNQHTYRSNCQCSSMAS